ncbi:MAG: DUF4259 domain-containing protein [Deltaproteobacteria bacterium]|nr:DUF4259 domain-containing protein [Deltaproteobacteria bacterium]
MSAWGLEPFENDEAEDWLAELSDWSSVRGALAKVVEAAPEEERDLTDCFVGLAAAEVVAAALGRPGAIPDEAADWVDAHRDGCTEQLRALAVACASQIESKSELQDLWDGDLSEEWHALMKDLIRRLSA